MLMPFGEHKDKELNTVPCSYLRWILRDVKTEAPLNVSPENREEYTKTRRLLRYEAERILKERRQNGVVILGPRAGTTKRRSFYGKKP